MRYKKLFEEVEKCKPSSILEIGTWNGKHAKQMIEIAQKYNKPITYYGFDLFEDFDMAEYEHCPKPVAKANAVRKLLRLTGANVELFKGNTKKYLAAFTPIDPVDFVFIDGGHSLETIASDWKNVQRFIHQDSVVIFDDYYEETEEVGCKSLLDSLSSNWNKKRQTWKWEVTLLGKDTFTTGIGKQTTCLMKVQFSS